MNGRHCLIKNAILYTFLLSIFILSGCQEGFSGNAEEASDTEHENTAAEVDIERYDDGSIRQTEDVVIDQYDGDPANTYDVVYTLDEMMTLTIESIRSKAEMIPLLDLLDEHQMTATFFTSPEQLEMYPEGTKEILDRGHMIENNAMYGMDVDALQHEEIYQRVETTNEMVETATGDSAEFAFVKNNDNKDLNAIVAQLDMTGIVTPVSELKPSDDEDKMLKNIKRAVARGGILSMDPDDASLIPYLKEAADEVDFEFIPLENLIAADETRKDFSEIEGADAIQPNEDMTDVVPHLHYQQPTTKRKWR